MSKPKSHVMTAPMSAKMPAVGVAPHAIHAPPGASALATPSQRWAPHVKRFAYEYPRRIARTNGDRRSGQKPGVAANGCDHATNLLGALRFWSSHAHGSPSILPSTATRPGFAPSEIAP